MAFEDDQPITTISPKLAAGAVADLAGSELQSSVDRLASVMDAFIAHRHLTDEQARALYIAIADARDTAERSAALGRVEQATTLTEPSLQALDELLINHLDAQAGELAERGIGVFTMIKPANVWADPARLRDLVNSVVAWGASGAVQMALGADVVGEDGHAALYLKLTPAPDEGDIPRPMRDSLGWLVIQRLCDNLHATVTRSVLAGLERKQAVDNGKVEIAIHFAAVPEGVFVPKGVWED